MKIVLLAAVLASLSGPALAEDLRDFCADRPGKATPPCILDKDHWQVEVGLVDEAVQRGGPSHEDDVAIGAFEIRRGLTRRVEMEAGWTPLIVDHVRGSDHVTGVGDAFLGVRTALTDPDADGGLAASLQGFVNAPTATHGLGAGGWTGGVRLPLAMPLGDLDLGATPEADLVRDADGHGTHVALQGAVGLSRGFGGFTAGAELWGQWDDDPAGHVWQTSVDFTGALAVGKNAQLDAGVNLGLNHATPDVEIYAGVARRF